MGGSGSSEKQRNRLKAQYILMLQRRRKKFLTTNRNIVVAAQGVYKASFISDTADEPVDWKYFFEDFIEKHRDTCFWAEHMLEYFLTYISRYFHTQFVPHEKRWIDGIIYERFARSLWPVPLESELSFDPGSYAKSDLEDKMMYASIAPGQFADTTGTGLQNTMLSKFSNEDMSIRALANAIDKSLRKDDNPFHLLIEEFKRYFSGKYLDNIREYKAEFYEEYRRTAKEAKRKASFAPKSVSEWCRMTREALVNIQYFIRLMLYSLILFYEPALGSEKLNYLRELMVNSLVDIVMRNKVYDVLFMFLRLEHETEEEVLTQKIETLRDVTPKSLGINPYLCLDGDAPLLEVARNARARLHAPPTEIKEEEKQPATNSAVNDRASILEPEQVLEARLRRPPYSAAIEKMREIASLTTPMRKLKCIASLNSVICKCIDDFWKGANVPSDKLAIDADQYLSVLIYIMVKANMPNMFTHITLSNEFATMGSRTNYNSYCLTTLQACFYHLLNVGPDMAHSGETSKIAAKVAPLRDALVEAERKRQDLGFSQTFIGSLPEMKSRRNSS